MSVPPNYGPPNAPYPPQGVPPKKSFPLWAGILIGCGGMFVLMIPILAAILFPVFAQAREKARQTVCMSNEKQIALSFLMYAQDNDDHLPPKGQWQTLTTSYIPPKADTGNAADVYRCPTAHTVNTSYAYNEKLHNAEYSALKAPPQTVLIFESDKDEKNAHGGPDILVTPGRHRKGNNFGYADGHVKYNADTTHQNFDPKAAPKSDEPLFGDAPGN